LAENSLSLNRRDDAIDALQKALQFFPQDVPSRLLLKNIREAAPR
jgi:hypothetical protein